MVFSSFITKHKPNFFMFFIIYNGKWRDYVISLTRNRSCFVCYYAICIGTKANRGRESKYRHLRGGIDIHDNVWSRVTQANQ